MIYVTKLWKKNVSLSEKRSSATANLTFVFKGWDTTTYKHLTCHLDGTTQHQTPSFQYVKNKTLNLIKCYIYATFQHGKYIRISYYIVVIISIFLKQSVRPNKYDVFALMHQGAALDSAHGGPNFPGWHRYYLYL